MNTAPNGEKRRHLISAAATLSNASDLYTGEHPISKMFPPILVDYDYCRTLGISSTVVVQIHIYRNSIFGNFSGRLDVGAATSAAKVTRMRTGSMRGKGMFPPMRRATSPTTQPAVLKKYSANMRRILSKSSVENACRG